MSGGSARSGNGRDERENEDTVGKARGADDERWEREKVSAVLYPV